MKWYQKKVRVNSRQLYKGFHIVGNSAGRYDIYDILLGYHGNAESVKDAQQKINRMSKFRDVSYAREA